MRFYATYSRGIIMTDDYTHLEILRGDHIKHIKRDLNFCGIKGIVKVFDENDKFICKLNSKKAA